MAVVEWQGQRFELQSNVTHFVDHVGREVTVSDFGPYDPRFLKAISANYIRDVWKWWEANRISFNGLRNAGTLPYDTKVLMNNFRARYKSYLDVSSSALDGWTYEHYKEYHAGSMLNPCLTVHEAGSVNTTGDTEHLLPRGEQPAHEKLFMVEALNYLGNIRVFDVSEQTPSTTINMRWTKFYNYSFKMDSDEFNFFRTIRKESGPMFGMELELSTMLSIAEIQRIVADMAPKQEPFFIAKQDGSVTGRFRNKYELVTVPATARYLRTHWKIFFQKLEKLAAAKGHTIGDYFDVSPTLTNGIHIHVSKTDYFSRLHMKKFLAAFNTWHKPSVQLLDTVSGRPTSFIGHRYCNIDETYNRRTLAYRMSAMCHSGTRSVCHDSSTHTVEVRLFQGIVDIAHIMRCISFTESIFYYCEQLPLSGVDGRFTQGYLKFIKGEKKYASILAAMGEKVCV